MSIRPEKCLIRICRGYIYSSNCFHVFLCAYAQLTYKDLVSDQRFSALVQGAESCWRMFCICNFNHRQKNMTNNPFIVFISKHFILQS